MREPYRNAAEMGVKNGCPFCNARFNKSLSPGERVTFLCGWKSDIAATVLDLPGWTTNEKWVHVDGEPDQQQMRLIIDSDMYVKLPFPSVPNWSLPLSVEDHCLVDDRLMWMIEHSEYFGTPNFDLFQLKSLISFIWYHRLPIRSADLLPFLEAHGHPPKQRRGTASFLDFGLDLLIWSNQRRPIRRRRISPLSAFRYLPESRHQEP